MELALLLKILTSHRKTLVLMLVFGVLLGIGVFLLPKKYIVEGSFFVGRQPTDSKRIYYSYDGYYGQQAAVSYTQTFATLLEGKDIKYEILNDLGQTINSNNLRKLNYLISVKTPGPQIVSVEVKHANKDTAVQIYNLLTSNALEIQNRLSTSTDTSWQVHPVTDSINIKRDDHILLIDAVVGGLLLPTIYFLFISTKSYISTHSGHKK